MYGYGTTEQENYFYFRRQYTFFIVLMFFPLFFPFFLYFFSIAGSWKCWQNVDKWRMWEWDPPLPRDVSNTVIYHSEIRIIYGAMGQWAWVLGFQLDPPCNKKKKKERVICMWEDVLYHGYINFLSTPLEVSIRKFGIW